MTVIMPQEPSTREGLAFAFVRYVGQTITDPQGDVSRSGRSLTEEETEAYNNALTVLNQFFLYPAPEWKTSPSGDGFYLISHLDKGSVEAVIVNAFGYWTLYNIEKRELLDISQMTCVWLGPLPLPPTFKKSVT